MGDIRIGVSVVHARAVGHLVEAIACGDWSDPDRFEQDVVAGVAHFVYTVVGHKVRLRPALRTACS